MSVVGFDICKPWSRKRPEDALGPVARELRALHLTFPRISPLAYDRSGFSSRSDPCRRAHKHVLNRSLPSKSPCPHHLTEKLKAEKKKVSDDLVHTRTGTWRRKDPRPIPPHPSLSDTPHPNCTTYKVVLHSVELPTATIRQHVQYPPPLSNNKKRKKAMTALRGRFGAKAGNRRQCEDDPSQHRTSK
ncbi:hypothetical protein CERZMDRAFT_87878 [Cercospora zeae-maydis SCOH1-5]|uniref:Uncharacterized protein n=1 Tax=Cercospora zeae-maydis SCOH1-5 TaxID=717836 RepID=A0A6A6F708_9PEZI|nr:hypothetical protein CERZMDRAFT_87878 [Cercospora zeae-maydis SCOH1-5]